MRKSILGLSAVLLATVATPAFAQDDADGITITGGATVVSDYRFRGVSQTGEEAAIQGTINVTHESGLYAGVWGSSIDLVAGASDLNTELDFYAGYSREVIPGLTADLGLLYYYYPKDGDVATDFFEPYFSLSGAVGPVNAKVGVAYAFEGQNALGDDDNIYVYTDANTAIPGTPFKLKGHVGYTDGALASTGLTGALSGNYWDWSVGAEASYKALTFGVSYVDTDIKNDAFGGPFGSPGANAIGSDAGIVFSVGASF
ncbi:TorF family putative porin [Rhizorhapis suberifaciens]|uniref:Uncharacterized protein (TIGR02001 family) n=1 Tax=Rhizorhapis suberifaciens TaxID=13656 RepID=A0A840HT69_9SPHN|nr:TorF family putative porin [Rhizorhapis suberifaciens]MBB4640807.1 uncharacterized protein (TIGR02001 family) [Rhizorhapis suberifaciens]